MQQPPLLQRRRALARAHQPIQHERLRFAQIPARGADQILPQPAQRPHALVAIHQDEPLGPLAVHDHDRHLLADRRQRPHQLAFRLGLVRPQLLVAQVQLVQLDVHAVALVPSRPAVPCAAAARGPAAAAARAGAAIAGSPPAAAAPRGSPGRKSRSAPAHGGAARGAGDPERARASHRRVSAASVRPRGAQRNPDASSFPAPRRARGTPVAAACGWRARARSAGTARRRASAAPAGRPARTPGSRCCPGHRGDRCAPPPCTARTRTPAPRLPPPSWRPEGFTPPAIRATLDLAHRGSRHRCGDQEARDLTPGLHPLQDTSSLATAWAIQATAPGHLRWVTSDEHTPGVSGERLRSAAMLPVHERAAAEPRSDHHARRPARGLLHG